MTYGHIREHLDLLEAHAYATLLTEASRGEFLFKTYGERLAARWAAEESGENPEVKQAVEAETSEDVGGKVLAYIMRLDPSRNQNYAQWLVNKYLKGGFRLEDGSRVAGYLTTFEKAKSRIEKKDINAYKDTAELYAAVKPFIEDGVAVSGKQEQDQEALRFAQPDQSTLLLDDAEMKVLIPKTQEAAIYFGRNTEWCTAAAQSTNYFDTYNKQGPLYIILLKAENRRWQWHFQSKQFMDEHDAQMRQPSMPEFCQQHPKIIQAIGEKAFIDYIPQIGLEFFSDSMKRSLAAKDLVKSVYTKEDFAAVPEDIRNTDEFIEGMILHNVRHRSRAAWNGETSAEDQTRRVLKWLPTKLYAHLCPKLVEEEPNILKELPPRLQTSELAHVAMEGINGYWQRIDTWIPKRLWDEKITDTYYTLKIQETGMMPDDMPEKYRTVEAVRRSALQVGEKGETAFAQALKLGMVDEEFATEVLKGSTMKIPLIPAKFYNAEMAELLFKHRDLHAYSKAMKDNIRPVTWLAKFPHDMLTEEMVHYLIDKGHIKSFDQLPASHHTNRASMAKVLKRAKDSELKKVPKELLTHDLIGDILDTDNLKHIDPSLISDEHIAALVKKHSYWTDQMWTSMPKSIKMRPATVETFVAAKAVPIKEIPKRLLTPRSAIGRLQKKADEYKELPPNYLASPRFAALAVAHTDHWSMINDMPDAMLTKPLLEAFFTSINKHGHNEYGHNAESKSKARTTVFKRFDPKLWDSGIVDEAIRWRFLPAEFSAVPDGLLDSKITSRILALNPDAIAKAPMDMLDEDTIAAAVESNQEVLDQLRPEQKTEAVAFAALTRFAKYSYYARDLNKQLPNREVWSERCWNAAVSGVCTLKEVPPKFRTPAVVKTAIMHDPENLKVLKNPAAYFAKNKFTFPLTDQRFRTGLENAGIYVNKTKEGMVLSNASDMPKKPIPMDGGFSYGESMLGTKNKIAYLFDKKEKPLVRFVTDKGSVSISTEAKAAKPFRKQIVEVLNDAFGGFNNTASLEDLDIFEINRDFALEEAAPRREKEGLSWSKIELVAGGSRNTLWIKNKPVLRITYGTSKAAFGRGTYQMLNVDVVDPGACIPVASKIFAYIHDRRGYGGEMTAYPGGHALERIGIGTKGRGDGYRMLAGKKVAEIEGMSIYTGDDGYLTICDKTGVIATAIMRKNGKLDKIEIPWRSHVKGDETKEQHIHDAFKRIHDMLVAKNEKKK